MYEHDRIGRLGLDESLPSLEERKHLARPYPGDIDVLFINVPSTFQQGVIPEEGEENPVGLLRIISTARESYGINAGLLDAHRLRLDSDTIVQQIERAGARLVCLNPTSVNISEGQSIAEGCDRSGVPYLLGGIHATLDPVRARKDFPNAFAIVRGHGEVVIDDIVRAATDGITEPIKGVSFREDTISGSHFFCR